MKDRIDRKDDESLYQPKIHSKRVKALYTLKKDTGKPMTVLLDQAIRELTERYSMIFPMEEEPILQPAPAEGWEEICEYRSFLDHVDHDAYIEKLEQIKKSEQGGSTNH